MASAFAAATSQRSFDCGGLRWESCDRLQKREAYSDGKIRPFRNMSTGGYCFWVPKKKRGDQQSTAGVDGVLDLTYVV